MRRIAVLAILLCAVAGLAAAADMPEISVNYSYQGSRPLPYKTWAGLQGGRGDVVWTFARHWSLVGEVAGEHTRLFANTKAPLTLFTAMVGPRLYLVARRKNEKPMRLRPFLQVVGGGAYATEGKFPDGTLIRNQAKSIAAAGGGGLELRLRSNISLRLIQGDVLYTRMPNGFENYQLSYRFGAGIIIDFAASSPSLTARDATGARDMTPARKAELARKALEARSAPAPGDMTLPNVDPQREPEKPGWLKGMLTGR